MCVNRIEYHGSIWHTRLALMIGYTGGNDLEDYFAKPSNHPGMGAVCQYLGIGRRHDLPGYVVLPAMPGYSQGLRRPRPYGGRLRAQDAPVVAAFGGHASHPPPRGQRRFHHKMAPPAVPPLPPLPAD